MALQKKPPVVTIMGHVDHGKTSLLDYIRKTKVAAGEAGEITQAIGAYQVELDGQKITFIDTPGHEAFIKMRQRGAQISDIVVLVVAANDGVMPQTKESLKIIKQAKVPFIVAINKIDLPEVSVDKVKVQLAENEVFVEGYGGDTVAVPVSAKTGQGVDQLLEMIILSSEMESLQADPQAELRAVVIESKFDKLCGSTATLIIQNGQLKKGTPLWVNGVCSKARMLKDYRGQLVQKALPGDPVLVLGFGGLPSVGTEVGSCQAVPEKKQEIKNIGIAEGQKPTLKIILKADAFGSLEAISECLPRSVEVMEKSVGEVKESDVLLARTLKADIYGFNLTVSSSVAKLSEAEKVKVRTFNIIYELLQSIEKRVLKLLSPDIDRKILGIAAILQVFEMKGQKIAGCRVTEGKINKTFPACIKREEKILSDVKIISLKEQKQDINEAAEGTEFGAVFNQKVDFLPGDVLISYSLEEN
ncbi:translation initiation factor IF-2 [Candidatus Shapirobacteria bacterium CG03_land_8_20_14_0_80_40_19]|uniref:Translation initiation factor IF-2 n=3 Tax=Candidatus Shapironibacteriota TaxID=1752721 RepID=A0A2M7BFY2_9BACT|nr:MAG: translation initiation factor IF-2 [Candidatus Shapirobacteria bacterium CG11_big_fil_rev_8_21_14_0_20_40_12]PIV02042.1 MAG: translation initiation factor IF-2 [Candidatus Shapirobacteria bacterium CG03_land_8_20_14_0_80_40_19]PJC29273.1 MAG: translation initiation factor IF-2 [Candidatus Shapirobacteria bacterium CG_4_9_14_0_2_um_filter_40_11]